MIIIRVNLLPSSIRLDLKVDWCRGRDYGFMRLVYKPNLGYFIVVRPINFRKAVDAIRAWRAETRFGTLRSTIPFAWAFAGNPKHQRNWNVIAQAMDLEEIRNLDLLRQYENHRGLDGILDHKFYKIID